MSEIAERSTAGEAPQVYRLPDSRRTGGEVLNAWSALRDRVGDLSREVTDEYRDARGRLLDERTTVIAQRETRELLEELSTAWGLSWALIARMVGVSPAAVRKWRRGESITGDHRRATARVIAFLESLAQSLNPLNDAASWLEMPLSDQSHFAAADVYARGHLDLLLDHAAQRIGGHEVLDRFEPRWRDLSERRFTVELAEDGMPLISEDRRSQ